MEDIGEIKKDIWRVKQSIETEEKTKEDWLKEVGFRETPSRPAC